MIEGGEKQTATARATRGGSISARGEGFQNAVGRNHRPPIAFARSNSRFPAIQFGIPSLDQALGGLHPGELWVIAAQTCGGS